MDKWQRQINEVLASYEAALPIEERVRAFVDGYHAKQGYPGFWEIANVTHYILGDKVFYTVLCYRFAEQIGDDVVRQQCYLHADLVQENEGGEISMVEPVCKEQP
jgi:hypothetical protein